MKLSKLIQVIPIAALLLLNTSCAFTAEADEITVEIDGEVISFDVEPEIIDGRTMVPVRKIFEEIGALVKWDDDTQTVSAKKNSRAISLAIDSADMQIDDGETDDAGNAVTETVTLDVPAQITDDRTLVPLRAVSEAFNLDVDWDEENSKVTITSKNDSEDDSWKDNTGEIDLDEMTCTGEGVSISDNKITITAGGDFTVSGTAETSITVNTEERVKIRLSGASITSDGEPCIYFEDADKAFITISGDTENSLISTNCEEGAIYSKTNLEIKGGGSLDITSDSGHGIKASDNLTVKEGTISINAAKDGIHINDTFKMTGGDITIEAQADGIDSESIVIIEDGTLDITTTAEPVASSEQDAQASETSQDMRAMQRHDEAAEVEFETSSKGIKAVWMMVISGGDITVDSADHAVHCADEIQIDGGVLKLSSAYGKGISGHGNVTIDGSDTVIDVKKSTEGIESKKVLTINDGDISVVSSDDALNGTGSSNTNADNGGAMPENGGNMTPPDGGDFTPPENAGGDGTTPPEKPDGDNGGMTPPSGGDFTPPENAGGDGTTPPEKPDGDNGGRRGAMPDNGGMGGGPGGNQKDTVVINGGTLDLTSEVDVIDANGNIVINGGTIKATLSSGGIVSFDGVLDADGSITVSDEATLITATRSGGTPTIDDGYAILVYADEEHDSDDKVCIEDESGKTVVEYTPSESFQTIFASSPKFKKNKTYTVTIGDETHEVTLSDSVTTVGSAQSGSDNSGNMGDRGGGPGGGMPGGGRGGMGGGPGGGMPGGGRGNRGGENTTSTTE